MPFSSSWADDSEKAGLEAEGAFYQQHTETAHAEGTAADDGRQ